MPSCRCGGPTKRGTKCRIPVKISGQKCRWHAPTVVTCSICMCEIEDDRRRLKHCGHSFHGQCILPWFVRCGEMEDGSLTCPNCRDVVTDSATVIWVGESTSEREPDEDWEDSSRNVWHRLVRAATDQRVETRRGLLQHIRGLFDRIAGHVTEDEE